jgi:EF hand
MRRVPGLPPLVVLALLAVAGCAPGGPPRRLGPPGEGAGPRAALFVSPAGKPFRAGPGGMRPIAAWFAEADADADGSLSYAEFQADFRRWFAALDVDHDGEIAPAEVTRYETEIFPEIASFRPGMGMSGGRRGGGISGPPGEGRRRGGGMRGGGMRGGPGPAGGFASGALRFGLLAIPHPIMSADENFNRGVSRAEFDRAAATRFNMLDETHSGQLTLAELAGRRARAFEERRGGRERRRRRASDS